MQRLTGLDAGFLWMETPSAPMHVAGLAIYDTTNVPNYSIEQIKDMVRGRLHLAPPFRRRLVTVPFGLHHPLWIEDPDFDLDYHIRRIAVPAPGGPRELADLAAHLDAIPLDRSHPLWEMWVIEGLDHGGIATLTKVHHAAIDGESGNQLTVSLFDLSPDVADAPLPAEPWKPDRIPSDLELLGYAASSLARQPWRVGRALRRTVGAALNLREMRKETELSPMPFTAPRTSLNRAITPARSFAMTTLSLADVKRVKNAFGATVNDVVLAMCATALRQYFDAHDEHPDGPLVAMVPVSVRAEADKAAMGNQVSSMFTSLATDVDDPVERLHLIHESMKTAKEQHHAIGADVLQEWAEFAAPAVFSRAARLYSRMNLANRHRPIFNVTISNVPGPPFPLWSAGVPLVANYPLGPIQDGGGLNMTVMSYQDNLDFGLLACPDLVDDVWSIADGLRDALEELGKAAAKLAPVEKRPAARRAPAKKGPAKKRAVAKKAPAKKRAVSKTAPSKKRAVAKKSPARNAARKAPANKAAAKRIGRSDI